MKKKFIYVLTAFSIITGSTGFGLLESSTVRHTKSHKKPATDSTLANTPKQFIEAKNHGEASKKEIEKIAKNQIAFSFMQWLAKAMKMAIQTIINALVVVAKAILVAILHFF